MSEAFTDFLRSVRSLSKRPGFTATVVLTLALGIGANTAIFSVVYALLLDPLPFPNSERLVMVSERAPELETDFVSPVIFEDWSMRSRIFEELSAFRFWENRSIEIAGGEPEPILHITATPNYFRTLGVSPAIGRIYADEKAGGVNEAVISNDLWLRSFGSSRSILGRSIRLNGNPYVVVGVMPALPRDITIGLGDIWTPLHRYDVQSRRATSFRARYLRVVARLKAELTVSQAQAYMTILQNQLAEEPGGIAKGYSAVVVSLQNAMVGRLEPVLWTLLVAVVFVLLTACSNVANLALARGVSQEKDVSVRLALGAGYRRVLQLLLIENMLLCSAGAVFGLAIAYGGLFLLKYHLVSKMPRLADAALSAPVLLFTVVVVLMCSTMVTLASFSGVHKLNLSSALRESGRTGGEGIRRQWLRMVLVASQIVFAVLLVAGAGFLLKSFVKLMDIRPGFEMPQRVVVDLVLPSNTYSDNEKRSVFYREMLRHLNETAEIDVAGASLYFPCRPKSWLNAIWREGVDVPEGQEPIVYYNLFAGDYFATMGIPLRSGRFLTEKEVWEKHDVLLVNESFARQLYPTSDAVGKRVRIGKDGPWLTIVGIVGDVRQRRLDEPPRPEFYVPFSEMPMPFLTLVVKGKLFGEKGTERLRIIMRGIAPDVALHNLMPLSALVADTVTARHLALVLLLLFSGLALSLAAIGIYGVVSYAVNQRRQEIGVRVALGATRFDVIRLIVTENLRVAGIAVLIGLLGAMAVGRVLGSLLYHVSVGDWSIYLGASCLALMVAFFASCIPALRAASLDPLIALRQE